MKLRISKNELGGALLIVLTASAVLGITLASYLQYTSTQSRSIMRSQTWNAGIPVAEAGVEEALAHINDSAIGTNFALNGWTVVSNQFQMTHSTAGGKYTVRISTNTFPIITSTGYTTNKRGNNVYSRTVRVTTTTYSTGMKGIITKGDINMNGGTSMDSFDSANPAYSNNGHYDPTKHKDQSYAASVYGNVTAETIYGSTATGPNGSAAGTVGDFGWVSGGNTGIEPGHYANDVNLAFPVVQAPFSGGASGLGGHETITLTNFAYWSTMVTTATIPTNPPPASDITTNLIGTNFVAYPSYPTGISALLITTNTTFIDVGMEDKTKVAAPPVGSYIGSITNQGKWRTYVKITGYSYPSITYTYSMTATNSSTTTQDYTYVLRNNQYQVTDLSMNGSDTLLVLGTNVTLYITRDFQMTGNSQVIIAPGASLKVFVGGDVNLAGNGIFNYTLDASHFSLYGLPTNHNIAISGNAAFTGVVYAPQADLVMNGSGNTIYDVVGAIVANTATLHGHFQFHYDEALGRAKIQSKYNVASWHEI
jgi:hypothetical protein